MRQPSRTPAGDTAVRCAEEKRDTDGVGPEEVEDAAGGGFHGDFMGNPTTSQKKNRKRWTSRQKIENCRNVYKCKMKNLIIIQLGWKHWNQKFIFLRLPFGISWGCPASPGALAADHPWAGCEL